MRLYLDQMLSAELGEQLRIEGHDVPRACETGQARADDAAILNKAREQQRVLVTLDAHFGDWTVLPLSHHFGVIRVRARPAVTANIAASLIPFLRLHKQEQFRDRLVILSAHKARWIATAE